MIYSTVNHSQLISNVDRLVRDVLLLQLIFSKSKVNWTSSITRSWLTLILNSDIRNHSGIYRKHQYNYGNDYPYNVFWDDEKTVQFINLLSGYEKA